MALISFPTRLNAEDFGKEDQEMAAKLAFILNPFLSDVYNAFQSNLSVKDNLRMEYRSFDVTVDAKGVPVTSTVLKAGLDGGIEGMPCVNVTNFTTPPTAQPFVGWTYGNSKKELKIQYVTGLVPGQKYTLRVLIHYQ